MDWDEIRAKSAELSRRWAGGQYPRYAKGESTQPDSEKVVMRFLIDWSWEGHRVFGRLTFYFNPTQGDPVAVDSRFHGIQALSGRTTLVTEQRFGKADDKIIATATSKRITLTLAFSGQSFTTVLRPIDEKEYSKYRKASLSDAKRLTRSFSQDEVEKGVLRILCSPLPVGYGYESSTVDDLTVIVPDQVRPGEVFFCRFAVQEIRMRAMIAVVDHEGTYQVHQPYPISSDRDRMDQRRQEM